MTQHLKVLQHSLGNWIHSVKISTRLFFDADKDGDDDLYVVSGGSEFIPGAPMYQDRLYSQQWKRSFHVKQQILFPIETTSGSCVAAADFDKDGDLDLFVGGRHSPANYAVIPRSFLFQNNSDKTTIKFSDVTSQVNAELSNVGMVTAPYGQTSIMIPGQI